MNPKDWIKILHKKPDRKEKILFFVLLGAVTVASLRIYVVADIKAIAAIRTQIGAAKQKAVLLEPHPKTEKPGAKEKNWFGTMKALQEAPESALNLNSIQNLRILKSQFSPMTEDQGRQKRTVSLSVNGSYFALEQYLNHLENMPAPLVVRTFSIKKSVEDPDVLSLEISGDMYGAN